MAELQRTLLWRGGIERHVASGFADALSKAIAAGPDLVILDRDLPEALRLVQDLRAARKMSIAVVARGDFSTEEVQLLEVGANAIFRLPAGPEWDDRLSRLMNVPRRESVRTAISVEIQAIGAARVDATELGRVLDVSVAGMLIECFTTLDMGTELEFSFRLPASAAPLVGSGRVVREAGKNRYGVEFDGFVNDGARDLRTFVGQQPGSRPN